MTSKTTTPWSSPIGPLTIVTSETDLIEIRFQNGREMSGHSAADTVLEETIRQLDAYFSGSLREFDLPLDPQGTEFQLEVWSALRDIPYGQTASYGDVARRIGRPDAVRAVGAANGQNPIPIVIPCHRVIGADGSLTGYGGGLEIKRALLALEGQGRLF